MNILKDYISTKIKLSREAELGPGNILLLHKPCDVQWGDFVCMISQEFYRSNVECRSLLIKKLSLK